jgi:hypothetical protein
MQKRKLCSFVWFKIFKLIYKILTSHIFMGYYGMFHCTYALYNASVR